MMDPVWPTFDLPDEVRQPVNRIPEKLSANTAPAIGIGLYKKRSVHRGGK